MDFMVYPTFEVIEDRGIIPKCYLPRDYKELVPVFYEDKGRERIEDYTRDFRDMII